MQENNYDIDDNLEDDNQEYFINFFLININMKYFN